LKKRTSINSISDFHKEKEMADFRKWLLALAAVAVLLGFGGSTAYAATTFTCQTNAGNPAIVRGEGVAELVGDLTLNCTGGTFTPVGQPIPLTNVQITLNTYITSRIVGAANLVSEAVLLIDEPFPAAPNPGPPAASNTTGAPSPQLGCLAINSVNCAITSVGYGIGAVGSYNGTAGHYNVFQGVQTGLNTITWQGVPIDAPGTSGTRTIRITNIRGNANLLGVSSTFIPTQITELIGVSGSQQILINNPSQTVAEAVPGLTASSLTSSYTQCNDVNGYLLGVGSGSPTPIGYVPGTSGPVYTVTATEGFGAAFKARNYNQIEAGNATPPNTSDPDTDIGLQNVPGFPYNTESGFIPGQIGATGAGYVAGGTGVGTVGLATQGTQLAFTFAGIPAGVTISVPPAIALTSPNYASATPGEALLVSGGSGTSDALGGSELLVSGTTATATYEITYDQPSVIESLNVPVYVSYVSNTAQNLPAPGAATVAVNFAPLSSSPTYSTTAPIPRFAQTHTPSSLFSIVSCTCNLLFPFVTNQAGFDTGIAIANTSADTLTSPLLTPQTGTVTLSYYGNTTGGAAAPPNFTTTSAIPAGSELIFTVSSGGGYGVPATPGFEGYLIAQADFQYCHGFAFISAAGAQGGAAGGYLAIQLDIPGLYRSAIVGENLGH
jgi:hypothetical protein